VAIRASLTVTVNRQYNNHHFIVSGQKKAQISHRKLAKTKKKYYERLQISEKKLEYPIFGTEPNAAYIHAKAVGSMKVHLRGCPSAGSLAGDRQNFGDVEL
jgi:hypothetical protein